MICTSVSTIPPLTLPNLTMLLLFVFPPISQLTNSHSTAVPALKGLLLVMDTSYVASQFVSIYEALVALITRKPFLFSMDLFYVFVQIFHLNWTFWALKQIPVEPPLVYLHSQFSPESLLTQITTY